MREIKAAVLEARGGPFRLARVLLPPPGPGEILVRVAACGICHTDLVVRAHDFGTPVPIVLGHEGAGVVETVGAGVEGLAPGDRVVLSFDSCGACPSCASGAPAYCAEFLPRNFAGLGPGGTPPYAFPDGRPLHGRFFGQSSFATHALASARNAVKIPEALPFRLAAPLGCSLQTGAGAVVNSAGARPGESLLVLGAGAVGLAAVMAGADLGLAPLVAVDRIAARCALARALGATHALAGGPGLAEALAAAAPAAPPGAGASFDIVIDTTGAPDLIALGQAVLAPRGRMVLLALPPPGTTVPLDPGRMLAGRVLRGAIEGDSDPQRFVPWLAARVLSGRFPVERLVRTYPLAAIEEAAADMAAGRTVKPVLLPEGAGA